MPSKKKIAAAVDWATAETCRLLDLFGERMLRFSVEYDASLADTAEIARVTTHGQLNYFRLKVGPGFLRESKEDRAGTILHEVMHVIQRHWRHLVCFSLNDSSMPEKERELFQSMFEDQMELYTDRLATVLAGRI
jgi:hypothetical protein